MLEGSFRATSPNQVWCARCAVTPAPLDAHSQAPWEAPWLLSSTGCSGWSASYWTVASTAEDLFTSEFSQFTLFLQFINIDLNFGKGQFSLFQWGVGGCLWQIVKWNLKGKRRKQDSTLWSHSIYLFHILPFEVQFCCQIQLHSVNSSQKYKTAWSSNQEKKNQCTDFILSHIHIMTGWTGFYLTAAPGQYLQINSFIFRSGTYSLIRKEEIG